MGGPTFCLDGVGKSPLESSPMRTRLGALVVLVGCSGDITDRGGDDTPVTLAFTSPAAGSQHARDAVEPSVGWRAADVAVELAITGTPATLELSAGDVALGTIGADGRGEALLI